MKLPVTFAEEIACSSSPHFLEMRSFAFSFFFRAILVKTNGIQHIPFSCCFFCFTAWRSFFVCCLRKDSSLLRISFFVSAASSSLEKYVISTWFEISSNSPNHRKPPTLPNTTSWLPSRKAHLLGSCEADLAVPRTSSGKRFFLRTFIDCLKNFQHQISFFFCS
jgi:hypothetical protein